MCFKLFKRKTKIVEPISDEELYKLSHPKIPFSCVSDKYLEEEKIRQERIRKMKQYAEEHRQ